MGLVTAARSVALPALATARAIVDLARSKRITFLAAGVAFYAFFSVIPTLLLVLAIGSAIGGGAFGDRMVAVVEGYLSTSGEAVLDEAIENPSGRVGASVIGVLALVWSALKVFRAVDIAFDRIYPADPETPMLQQVRNGAIVMVTIGVSLGLLIGAGTLLARSAPGGAALVASWLLLVGGLVVVLLPLYYVMPPVPVSVREILPGTITAGGGWLLLQALFQVYATNAAQYQAYGLVGAVLLFMLWLYLGAVALLFGAVVNVVLAADGGGTTETAGGRHPRERAE